MGLSGYRRGSRMNETEKTLAEIRASIVAENVSYGELSLLQGLAVHIDPSDTLLLEWAGVPENE